MAYEFRNIYKGITLKGLSANPVDAVEGSIFHNSTDKFIRAYLDSAVRTLVTDTQVQILTNKQLTLPKINEAVDLTATSTDLNQLDGVVVGGTASGDIVTTDDIQTLTQKTLTLPKVNEAVDLTATSTELNQLDGVSVGGNAAGDILTTNDTQTVTGKSINADNNTITNIDNDEIKAAAGIEVSKLEALSSDKVVITDSSGFLNASIVDTIELNYVSGVTSPIQGQLDDKVTGPLTSTDNAVTRYDGTSGTLVQNSLVTIDDSGNIATPGTVDGRDVSVDGGNLDTHIAALSAHGATGNIIGRGDSPAVGDTTGTYDDQTVSSIRGVTTPTPVLADDGEFMRYDHTSGAYVLQDVPLSGDVTGDNTASTVVAIQNTPIPAPLTANNGQAIIYNDVTGEFEYGDAGGGAGGGFNLESDPYAQQGVGDWTLYDDAAATPVDLTGGTVTSTFTTLPTSTVILDGDYQGVFQFAKPASNVQGEGVAKAFSIAPGVRQQGNIIVRVRVSPSVAIALGDFKLAAYDVTNSRLLPTFGLTNGDIPAIDANGTARLTVRIPVESTTASIRLGFHVATTNTTAINLRFSDLSVGVDSFIDLPYRNSALINLAGSGNFTGGQILVTREGSLVTISNLVAATFASSATPASAAGLIPDWARPSVNKTNVSDAGSGTTVLSIVRPTGIYEFSIRDWAGVATALTTVGTGPAITYNVEDTQSAIISTTEAVNQTARFRASRNGISQTIGTNNSTVVVEFFAANFQTGIRFDGPNYRAEILESGIYSFDARISTLGTNIVSGSFYQLAIHRNGTSFANGEFKFGVTGQGLALDVNTGPVFLNAGDLIDVRFFGGGNNSINTLTLEGGVTQSYFSGHRIPDFTTFGVYKPYERLESVLTTNTIATAVNTFIDVSAPNLTLSPGKWRIGYSIFCLSRSTVAGPENIVGDIRITTTGNTLVPNSIAGWFLRITGAQPTGMVLTREVVIDVLTTTSYKLRIRNSSSVGQTEVAADSITGGLTAPSNASIFYAERIL